MVLALLAYGASVVGSSPGAPPQGAVVLAAISQYETRLIAMNFFPSPPTKYYKGAVAAAQPLFVLEFSVKGNEHVLTNSPRAPAHLRPFASGGGDGVRVHCAHLLAGPAGSPSLNLAGPSPCVILGDILASMQRPSRSVKVPSAASSRFPGSRASPIICPWLPLRRDMHHLP